MTKPTNKADNLIQAPVDLSELPTAVTMPLKKGWTASKIAYRSTAQEAKS